MDRVYGENNCSVCRKIPSLGFLYTCKQDYQPRSQEPLTEVVDEYAPDESDYFDVMARLATSLRMSPSVISQIRRGHYSFDQVDTLIKQKEHVISVIKQAQTPAQLATPPASPICGNAGTSVTATVSATPPLPRSSRDRLPGTPAGTPANTSAESTNSTPKKSQRKSAAKRSKCRFQACHGCRPFFVDRLHTLSFEAVFNNEVPAITEQDITQLPFRDPSVVRNLGLREPPQPALRTMGLQESMDVVVGQSFDSDDDWSPTSGTNSEGEGDFGDRRKPWATSKTQYPNNMEWEEVDLGLRIAEGTSADSRMLRQIPTFNISPTATTSSTASSLSLPTPVTATFGCDHADAELFNAALTGRMRKAASHIGMMPSEELRRRQFASRNNSNDSLGSEVEVEGGVALTEDAVAMHTPDIITQV